VSQNLKIFRSYSDNLYIHIYLTYLYTVYDLHIFKNRYKFSSLITICEARFLTRIREKTAQVWLTGLVFLQNALRVLPLRYIYVFYAVLKGGPG
jgi:hypothetical protein